MDVHETFGWDRKAFALEGAGHLDPHLRAAIFKAWDHKGEFDWRGTVLEVIKKNLGTQTKVDGIRRLFGGGTWNMKVTGDD
jgi:hypothetical protein